MIGVRTTAPDVAELTGGVAVLPIGAVEQHGAHLPIATDAILVDAFVANAVETVGAGRVWLLPTITYGKSTEHDGFVGTVSLSATTLSALIHDVAVSVAASGLRGLLLVTAHGGNPEVLGIASRDLRSELGLVVRTVHVPSLALDGLTPGPDDGWDVHGGHYETSVMLALHPELVRMNLAAADGERWADLVAADSTSIGSWFTRDVSATGIIGDPRHASAEWGKAAFAAQSAALAAILETLIGAVA